MLARPFITRLLIVFCFVSAISAFGQGTNNPLDFAGAANPAHIMPSRQYAATIPKELQPSGGGLTFHEGPVMATVQTFAIFWLPAKLQDGSSSSFSTKYRSVQERMLDGYSGHGLGSNNTQYYSDCFTFDPFLGDFHCQYLHLLNGDRAKYYITGQGSNGPDYLDRNPYPLGSCFHRLTQGNCVSDSDIQAEIKKDIPALRTKGWHGGLNQMILVYTSSGEGSCLQGGVCSYTAYCGYHSYFSEDGLTAIIYSNEPFTGAPWGDQACQFSIPSPNDDPAADAAASVASHELSEAITDPLLTNGWRTADLRYEIGDLCLDWNSTSNTFGVNTWDSGIANQMWGGGFLEIQQEWDNHASGGSGGCVQLGP